MARKQENTGFICAKYAMSILPLSNGSYRNHCPFCLYSLHVDIEMGDRKSQCRGLMEPLRLTFNSKKGWQIVHNCMKCGHISHNKVAEFTDQPDDYAKLAMR